MASVSVIPPAALTWLTGEERTTVLLIGASPAYVNQLLALGHRLTVIDEDLAALTKLAEEFPQVQRVVARGESLPFDPSYFGGVVSIQNFHTFAPGLALGEWARVLDPEGCLGLAYLTRDDTVPWVKKLKAIVQAHLPEAMTSDLGRDSVAALADSIHFPRVEQISHRLWVPCARRQLQDNARQAEGADQLAETELEIMLDEIGELYDRYARVPDPLLLPYQISGWRGRVDQSSLLPALTLPDDGLSITL